MFARLKIYLLLFVILVSVANAKWHIETVDSSENIRNYPSIVLKDDTIPCIAYEMASEVWYAERIGGVWQVEFVVNTNLVGGCFPSLALDSLGRQHISYHHYVSSGDRGLRHAKKTASGWVIDLVPNHVDYESSIAISDDSIPCIAYYGYYARLYFAKQTSSGWQVDTVVSDTFTANISLAIDKNGFSHIAANKVLGGGMYAIMYAKWNGSLWEITMVDSIDKPLDPELALDSLNNPHISYFTLGSTDAIMYAKWNGASWDIQPIDSPTITAPSITIDKNENPHIAYHAYYYYPMTLMHAKYNGIEFIKDTVDRADPPETSWVEPSIKIDNSNSPHISYRYCWRFNNTFPANLKYAYFTNQSPLPFSLISPPMAETLTTLTPTFTWHKSVDPDTENVTYTLYLADSLGTILDSITPIADTFVTWQYNLPDSTKYFWKVKAVDPYGEIAWCNETDWWFYIQTEIGIHVNPEESFVISKIDVFPNPAKGFVVINFQLANPKIQNLTIYDITGRLVRCIKIGDKEATGTIVWDCKDANRCILESGVYFIIDEKNTMACRKFVLYQ